MNPFKSLEKKIKRGIEKLGNDVKKGVTDTGNKVKREAEAELRKIQSETKKATQVIEKEAKKLEGLAEKTIEAAIDELAKALSKEGLKKIHAGLVTAEKELSRLAEKRPDLVGEINNLGFELPIGPVTLTYSNFYDRVSSLIDAVEDLTRQTITFRQSTLINVVKVLGPDETDLGIDVQLAALVVSSKTLGIGFKLKSIGVNLFTEIAAAIMDDMGVPK